MSAFYDLASLVLVPSGYKSSKVYAQKPLTTDGQLAFTRNTGATRVNSAGLIEKVRTNVLLQSNTFSTTWTTTNTSVTSGQSGYDGTNDAWKLTKSAASGRLQQGTFSAGVYSFSVYLKADTNNWVLLYLDSATATDPNCFFDLENGTVGTGTNNVDATIKSVGNGWYRCSVIANVGTTFSVMIFPAEGDNDASSTSGSIYIQNAQLETGDIATDYIETTSAAVSVGPVANVPRLDYLGSSCPRLLLEPQRTNLCTYSEQINQWAQERTSVTANAITSPDGYTNADKVNTDSTPDTTHQTYNGPFTNTAGNVTFSGFFKKGEYDWVHFGAGSANSKAWFNLNTGVVGTKQSDVVTTSMVDYGNGWYRCISVVNLSTTSNYIEFGPASVDGSRTISGTPSGGIYGWGLQMENASSYATSYIPTLGAAVTRGADAATKTGISSLIGQTEGTIYWEGSVAGISSAIKRLVSLSDGTTNNAIYVQNSQNTNNLVFFGIVSGVSQFSISAVSAFTFGQQFKLAAAYKANDFVLYVNGVQIGSATSGSVPATSKFAFDRGNDTTAHEGNVAQALLFKTRLTNAQLAELTTL